MDLIEDCPVCKQHTLVWTCAFDPTCTNCGWWPVSIPWDIEDYQDDIKKYNENNHKN